MTSWLRVTAAVVIMAVAMEPSALADIRQDY